MEDRVADLRALDPEATAAALAFLESRPVAYDLPMTEHDGVTYLDLRWAVFRDVGFKRGKPPLPFFLARALAG